MFDGEVNFLEELVLIDRLTNFTNSLLLAVLVNIILIGYSVLSTNNLFNRLALNFLKLSWRDNEFSENLRMSTGTSVALIANYLLSLGLCFFLALKNITTPQNAIVISSTAVAALLVVQQLSFRLIVFSTGEKGVIPTLALITRHIWKFSGIALLMIAIVWILNQNLEELWRLAFLVFLATTLLLRLLKGFLFMNRVGLSWYYFILYLCTLEILPFVLIIGWLIWVFRLK
jgi:hypothetical protein